jgi:uncharacterized membrane protein
MGLLARLRGSFLTGIVLIAPLAVTVFVFDFALRRLSPALDPVVQGTRLTAYVGGGAAAYLLAAALVAVAVTAFGFVASWSLGRRLFGGFERGVRFLPIVRTVYFGVRQVGESLDRRGDGYDSVALVEYPREGVYAVGFVTGEAPSAVAPGDEPAYSVFLPNSPNPTGGRLVVLPESEVIETEMSVRRAVRLLVTTGLGADDVEDLPEGVAR